MDMPMRRRVHRWFPTLFVLLVFPFALGQGKTLSLASGSSLPGGSVTLNVSLSGSGSSPAALQWTMGYSAQHFSSVSVATGASATAAGKSIECSSGSGSRICVLSGVNGNTMADGVVARVTLTVSPGFGGSSSSLSLTSPVAASAQGSGVSISASGGAVTILPPPNTAPTSSSQSVTTQSGTPVSITLHATDPDGNPLTYIVASQPSHGALTGSAPNLTYTSSSGFIGSDSFTFRASDGSALSNLATVSITVTSPPISGSPCDLNEDGSENVIDAQLGINQALGVMFCGSGDIDLNGFCNVVDVQRLINSALGLGCQSGSGS